MNSTSVSRDDSSEDEDNTESSSSQSDVENVLAHFRENWHKEIKSAKTTPKHQFNKKSVPQSSSENSSEDLARKLFLKGTEMEKAGKLYEAVQYYRKAVQIVPDIEFRLDFPKSKPKERTGQADTDETGVEDDFQENDESGNESYENASLLPKIEKKCSRDMALCTPKFEQSTTHISVLPVEIILLILKWLVSNDLDLRSLESFGRVCRGFYLCARDEEIWRLACLHVWGLNISSYPNNYSSWRNMYVERPRVQFNGCYISKTSYVRNGENSFQDTFYRPWYLVDYYRYFRFFPDGKVLVLTTSDEPAHSVAKLKNRFASNPVLIGYYRILDDKVTLIVHKTKDTFPKGGFKNTRQMNNNPYATSEQTFHMELHIKKYGKKHNAQLVWTHYSIYTVNRNGDESTCKFDLVPTSFPPLWFSRVKSFTCESESILQ